MTTHFSPDAHLSVAKSGLDIVMDEGEIKPEDWWKSEKTFIPGTRGLSAAPRGYRQVNENGRNDQQLDSS